MTGPTAKLARRRWTSAVARAADAGTLPGPQRMPAFSRVRGAAGRTAERALFGMAIANPLPAHEPETRDEPRDLHPARPRGPELGGAARQLAPPSRADARAPDAGAARAAGRLRGGGARAPRHATRAAAGGRRG